MAKTNPFDILRQKAQLNSVVSSSYINDNNSDEYVKFSINARMAISAAPGYVLASIDYRNQELYVAAMESDDEVMQLPFSTNTPDFIKGDDGKEYPNPSKDLHTLTTVACEPTYFDKSKPWTWDAIARDNNINPYVKGSMRGAIGKTTNFGCAYMQSPKSLSDLHYIPLKKAEQYIKGFKLTYPKFTKWAEKKAMLGEARGWIQNSDNRFKFCNESNSKGSDNASGRMAVNTSIQGLSASISKRGHLYTVKAYINTPCRVLGLIHDELLIEVPGEWELVEDECFKKLGEFHPKFKISDEAKHWASIAADCLEKSEEEVFRKIYKGKDFCFKGLTETQIAPYWSH